MKARTVLFGVIILIFMSGSAGCEKDKVGIKQLDGYIVGFDPCTIHQGFRIGYIIVSADLKDTVMTYNISDVTYKMPASILSLSGNVLYTIPESDFKNVVFFPVTARYDFKVHISYRYPNTNESYSSPCLALYLSGSLYKEIVVASIAK
jgi:hypothetical protein